LEEGGYIHNEPDLLRRRHSLASQDLRRKVGRKWHEFTCNERVALLVTSRAKRWAFEKRSEVESRECVEDNHLVRGIGVDALVEREVGG
jgi:hypothetical protein